ncbi:hypothetical protein Nmel_016810 [Mimus melanotis]
MAEEVKERAGIPGEEGQQRKGRFLTQYFRKFFGSPIPVAGLPNSARPRRARSAFLSWPGTATCRPPSATAAGRALRAPRGLCPALLPRETSPALPRRAAPKQHRLPCLKDLYYVLKSVGKPLSCRESHRQRLRRSGHGPGRSGTEPG